MILKRILILLSTAICTFSTEMLNAGEAVLSKCITSNKAKATKDVNELRILTFNIWQDGRHGTIDQIVKVIRASEADIVGLQEECNAAPKLAKILGWNYLRKGSPAILSRYPILGTTPQQKGVIIKHESGRILFIFNNHLMYIPYQPYQLLKIPYGRYPFLKTEAEAIATSKKTRGQQITDVLKEVAAIQDRNAAIFIIGDFNEPSHQDWTARAAKAKRHPIKVAYPNTLAITKAGFTDSYRAIYPDEMKNPGYTWTPRTKADNPKDHHDRIDFIFFRGPNVKIKSVKIIGPDVQQSDIVVNNYPSDHRSVSAVFKL